MGSIGSPGSFWSAVAGAFWRAPCYLKLFLGWIVIFVLTDYSFSWATPHYRRGSSLYELGVVPLAFSLVAGFRVAGVGIEMIEIFHRFVIPPSPQNVWGPASTFWVHLGIIAGVLMIPARHLPLIRFKMEKNQFVALEQEEKSRHYWGGEDVLAGAVRNRSTAIRFLPGFGKWLFMSILLMVFLGLTPLVIVSMGYSFEEMRGPFYVLVGMVLLVLVLARGWFAKRG